MTDMRCNLCGRTGISWVGDLLINPSTLCPHCGGRNCQEAEPYEEEDEAMTDTDMVERVAEAIWLGDELRDHPTFWSWGVPEKEKEEFRTRARAAIRTMRDNVNDEMLVAGRYQLDHAQRASLLTCWRVMHNTALGEEKSGE